MSRVIAVANYKGGTGKSTVAINLAARMAERGNKVALAETGHLGMSTVGAVDALRDANLPVPVITLADFGQRLGLEVRRRAAEYDVMIVDCPSGDPSKETISVCCVADLVLLPMVPFHLDLMVTKNTAAEIEAVKHVNPGLIIRCLLNQVLARGKLDLEIRNSIHARDLNFLEVSIDAAEDWEVQAIVSRADWPSCEQFRRLADELTALLQVELPSLKPARSTPGYVAPSRRGLVPVTLHLTREARRQLREVALSRDTSMQELLRGLVNQLLQRECGPRVD